MTSRTSRALAGHAAIITGAASGIGRAAVERFLADGAAVVAVDLDVTSLTALSNDSLLVVAGDASDEADVRCAADLAVERFGRLDSIFANAGVAGSGAPLVETTVDELMRVLRINAGGALVAAKVAEQLMSQGAVTFTASVAGLRASAGSVAYSASKAAVISLAQTCASALAGSGLRVNALCPGLTRTGMTEGVFRSAEQHGTTDRLGQLNPLGRAADPVEIAAVAAFLAGPDASYVNGQAISVDGGLSATLPFARWRR